MTTERVIIAGAGGQGILLAGKIVAHAAMREGKHVTWLPSYGAEVRGGTAHCLVTISDHEIGSPYIEKADSVIVLNEPSLLRFMKKLSPKGLLVANSSLMSPSSFAKKISAVIVKIPATEVALQLGNMRVANVVTLGAYIASKNIVKPATVMAAIDEIAPPGKKHLVAINKQALQKGMELVK